MNPYWNSDPATLYLGDVRECLRAMPSQSVHCVATSPPYWALRSYCNDESVKHLELGSEEVPDCWHHECGKCYVCHMAEVFDEVHRVLRDDGVCWLNLGDSYSSGGNGPGDEKQLTNRGSGTSRVRKYDIPDGNLVGIPWRVALALQASGWVIRSEVPWVKRGAMPDSAANRPGKSLEYVFMLTKSASDYYFDMEAIKPVATSPPGSGGACFGRVSDRDRAKESGASTRRYDRPAYSTRNFRNSDLWFQSVDTPHLAVGSGNELVGLDVTPSSAPGGQNKKSHFAVWPTKLVETLILAGTSEVGCCSGCGSPLKRITKDDDVVATRPVETGERARADANGVALSGLNTGLRCGFKERVSETVGWRRTCKCDTTCGIVPCIVLDPFVGSGTTVAAAVKLGRHGIGIDLSEVYLRDHAVPRVEAALAGEELDNGRTRTAPVVPTDCDPPPPPRALRLK